MSAFLPETVKTFRFVSYQFDPETSIVRLNYAFDDHYFFSEELFFPEAKKSFYPEELEALDNCLYHLHLVAGISYYKAAVPPEIKVETKSPNQAVAFFMEKLYLHGLGEFSFKNKLDLKARIKFPYTENSDLKASSFSLPETTIVPVGGGKDSVVTLELLRNKFDNLLLFSVGNPPAIKRVAEASGLKHLVVKRKISPLLLELNTNGAYNGHVPISAILAFIMTSAAVIYGFDQVAMSNERSANVGNLFQDGLEINHQYSKSLAFEEDVNNYFHQFVLTNFNYFSFLRPLSELAIAGIFSRFSDYHQIFTSCNAAFRLDEKRRIEHWCANCDKCRFVFLCLAPFLGREKLTNIFGVNLLDQEEQLNGYNELLGISGHKPFECVGEVEECLAAFVLLLKKDEWADSLLVEHFRQQVYPALENPEKYISEAFTLSAKHLLTSKYLEILNENTGSF